MYGLTEYCSTCSSASGMLLCVMLISYCVLCYCVVLHDGFVDVIMSRCDLWFTRMQCFMCFV